MSVTSTASPTRPNPPDQGELVVHDRRVTVDGMDTQYLEASTAMARALFGPNGQRQILLDQLPTLTTPTLVIWGGCDYVLPAHQAQAAVNLLPDGRLSVFPDCGHLPHVEQTDRFAAVLGDWLTEHREQQSTSPASTGSVLAGPWRRTA